MSESSTFLLPAWATWIVYALAWGAFIATDLHWLEAVAGLTCALMALIAIKNSNWYFVLVSLLSATWMLSWAFEIDIVKSFF